MSRTMALLKPSPFTDTAYAELLQVLYDVFQKARKDGLVGLKAHIEDPEKGDVFTRYPNFTAPHHAVAFLPDTLKLLLTGTIEHHHLDDILETNLEQHNEEGTMMAHAVQNVADAMPAPQHRA